MTLFTKRVVASTDDCARRITPDYWATVYVEQFAGKYDGSNYKYGGGMRFTVVTIPKNATIDNAKLTFIARSSDNGSICKTEISGEKIANALTFGTSADFDTRRNNSRTTAVVQWDSIGAWVAGSTYDSPDITSIIQEIVNQATWASGNALVLFWDDFANRSTGTDSVRSAKSYDQSTTECVLLTVNYHTVAAPTVTTQDATDIGRD
jgi:type IV pilus assembly protein PilY1